MKYLFMFLFALILGCSSMNNAAPSSPYVIPGTFIGIWTIKNVTMPCTAIVTKSDSLLIGKITNDSTKEILYLTGIHVNDGAGIAKHVYWAFDSSSFIGKTDTVNAFHFTNDGNTLSYLEDRLNEPEVTTLTIVCVRK